MVKIASEKSESLFLFYFSFHSIAIIAIHIMCRTWVYKISNKWECQVKENALISIPMDINKGESCLFGRNGPAPSRRRDDQNVMKSETFFLAPLPWNLYWIYRIIKPMFIIIELSSDWLVWGGEIFLWRVFSSFFPFTFSADVISVDGCCWRRNRSADHLLPTNLAIPVW